MTFKEKLLSLNLGPHNTRVVMALLVEAFQKGNAYSTAFWSPYVNDDLAAHVSSRECMAIFAQNSQEESRAFSDMVVPLAENEPEKFDEIFNLNFENDLP